METSGDNHGLKVMLVVQSCTLTYGVSCLVLAVRGQSQSKEWHGAAIVLCQWESLLVLSNRFCGHHQLNLSGCTLHTGLIIFCGFYLPWGLRSHHSCR